MDFYQGVVADYLRADRSIFLNTEFCLQDSKDKNPDFDKGKHWYVDAVAISIRDKRVYLCEVTYGRDLSPLIKRISAWSQQWELVSRALERDAGIPRDWLVRPWIFMPRDRIEIFLAKFSKMQPPFKLLITPLEMTAPWCYNSWDRRGEGDKPACVPIDMRT